jgi:GTP-binding protein
VLIHLIDATEPDPAGAWRAIRGELTAYGAGLEAKPEIVALNKIDALTPAARKKAAKAVEKAAGVAPRLVSGVSGEGVKDLLRAAFAKVERRTSEPADEDSTWMP